MLGWGGTLSSNIRFNKKRDVVRLQAVYGKGIQNYFNDAPVDIAAEHDLFNRRTPLAGVALPIFGAVHRPENYAVANAIGASIAQVGGEIDKVYAVEPGRREEAIAAVRAEAVDKAIAAGASPTSVAIVDFDEVPIPYLPGNATRIRVKAVGDLAMGVRV